MEVDKSDVRWERLSESILDDTCWNPYEGRYGYLFARFLHKTVYEILSSPDIRGELIRVAEESRDAQCASFSALQSLMRATLLKIKTFSVLGTSDKFHVGSLEKLVYRCLAMAREVKNDSGIAQTKILTEIDCAMTYLSTQVRSMGVRVIRHSQNWIKT